MNNPVVEKFEHDIANDLSFCKLDVIDVLSLKRFSNFLHRWQVVVRKLSIEINVQLQW